MISDKYVLWATPEDIDRVLDITEHMAACYGYDKKELMRIRLIAEEMIISVQSGITISQGELWFCTERSRFIITVSVNTDIYGMPKEERKKLLKSFSTVRKSGLFGTIQAYMEEMAAADSGNSLYGFAHKFYGGDFSAYYPQHFEVWDKEKLEYLASSNKKVQKEEDWGNSLLKGFADDITVTSKLGRFEMSVMKNIPAKFMSAAIAKITK